MKVETKLVITAVLIKFVRQKAKYTWTGRYIKRTHKRKENQNLYFTMSLNVKLD
jgi:hypothetical protein